MAKPARQAIASSAGGSALAPADGVGLMRDNLSRQAHRHIKDRLIAGKLPPAARLGLRDVAIDLGISVTPAREALLQLVAERALVVGRGNAIHVAALSAAHCRELWDIRLCLEQLAAEAALPRITTALIRRMAVSNELMLAAKQARDVDGGMDHNRDFHFALYEAAAMPTLFWTIETLWAQAGAYVRYFLEHHVRTRTAASVQGPHVHATIVEALRRGDAAGLRRGMARDLIEIRDGILGLLPGDAKEAARGSG